MTTLHNAIEIYGKTALLLTAAPAGPHTAHVQVTLDGDALRFTLGGTALANAKNNPNVSLLWPPIEQGGYSIIINGKLQLDSANSATVKISKSVFHRPGESTLDDGLCTSDCLPLTLA